MNGFERHGGAAAAAIAEAAALPRTALQASSTDLEAALRDYEIARALADAAPWAHGTRAIAQYKFQKIRRAMQAAGATGKGSDS